MAVDATLAAISAKLAEKSGPDAAANDRINVLIEALQAAVDALELQTADFESRITALEGA